MIKLVLAALACMVALAGVPAATFAAGPMLGTEANAQATSGIELVAEKKKAKAAKKSGKPKKAKKAEKAKKAKKVADKSGRCGTYMYWSPKGAKCMDARSKK